ncbi:GIP [Symbiodinium sp. CCMP2456]|nr:GIP [Symbiodinium sp. CCMP2456]
MTPSERLLEKLAEGIQQLQRVQIDHLEKAERKKDDETPEQCKPGTASLPMLPMPNGNESAVALQDWIEVIDGPLRDVSDSSSWWWDAVKKRAQESYQRWVASGPYERLALKPPTAEDLEKGRYSRLSARTAGMMLQAMAESVRAEMVARAITRSPVALLFRLYTMYQPGGESEKAYILQYLVTPPKAQTAAEMVSVLRQWERMLLRADNLNIAKPDPSLLVRGLNLLVAELWAKDRDVTFRTQLVKSRLGISKKNRCYTCGAEGHVSNACPTKADTGDMRPDGLKPRPKPKPKSAPTTPTARDDAAKAGTAAARSMTAEPEPQPSPPTSPTTTTETQSAAATGEVKEALRDAARALRLKAIRVDEEVAVMKKTERTPLDERVNDDAIPTLIDSGATHILRQPRDGQELAAATKVSVTLANDERRDLLQAESGAILTTSPGTQPILPMAELVSAGCEISWKRGVFKVIHPVWGELRTSLRGGCSELAQEQAAKLVNDIETKKLNEFKEGVSMLKSKLEHLAHEEKLPWTGYVMRRMRKRMLESRKWIVHVPGHRDDVPLKPEAYGEDAVLVTISGELPLPVYEALLWGAATGRIAAVVGSTPGTSMCKEEQSLRTAKVLGLYVVGRLARSTSRTGFFWSVPKSGGEDYVSRLLKEFSEAASMNQLDVSRSPSEGQPKFTMMAVTNYRVRSPDVPSQSEEGAEKVVLPGWSTAWRLEIARAVREEETKDKSVPGSGSLKAMSPEQWKEHVRAGHYPARRDCLQCVTHGATGHRHARVEHPSLFCLNVDITGPFRTTGEDPSARGDRKKAAKMKYLLVAKFTLPKSYVTGEFEPTGTDPPDEELGHKDLFDEEDRGDGHDVPTDDLVGDFRDEEFEADPCDDGGGVGDIPLDVKPPENAVPMDIEAPEATYLLFAEPLLNDKGTSIASAIQSIVLYLQSLNIPVLRFHSDRDVYQYPECSCFNAQGEGVEASFTDDGEFWGKGLGEETEASTWDLGLSDQVANGHLVDVDGIFAHARSVRDKAKLVDAAEDYVKDDARPLEFEGDAEPPLRKRRIHGKSSPRVAMLDGEFGPELCDDEIPSDYEEDFDAAKIPREQDQDVQPRVAVLSQPMNSGPYDDDVHSDQEDLQNPEDYAKEIIYSEEDVTEEVIEKLFELLPNQRLVNQFIRTVLGASATWSTFSLHRNLSVKRHRDSHNARDELSYLIPISDFRQGGLWTQADIGEVIGDDEVVIVDGKRGRVKPLQSEEGTKEVVSFNPRRWHATMPWTGDRLVLAVYKVRGLNKIKAADEDVALDLGFPLPTNDAESPRMCKLLGQEGEQPGPEPQEEVEVELEPVEDFMYIRMSEEEWRTTIERYGADHYVAEMATRWRRIEPEEGNLNSVIPAAIAADIDRDWVNAPSGTYAGDKGQGLRGSRTMTQKG